MLEAKKSAWFEKPFLVYNRHLLKRRFNSLQISGLEFIKRKNPNVPMIIYANHSSWWDGLVIWEILKKSAFESYVMMEEQHLRKLFLFRHLGAFSVVRENPRQALQSINYAARILTKNSNRAVLIFPQGQILANDLRPLHFYNGLSRIIGQVPCSATLPLTLRYEFAGNFKPEIFVKIAEPINFNVDGDFDKKKTTALLENRLTETLDELRFDVIQNKTTHYEKLF